LVWIVFGSGFGLTGWGLIAATGRLDKTQRAKLAHSLLIFGAISFVLALGIAHIGFVLLVFAFPALVLGAIVRVLAAFGE
jgi:hypothetical protein